MLSEQLTNTELDLANYEKQASVDSQLAGEVRIQFKQKIYWFIVLFPLLSTCTQELQILWNHHCSWGTNGHGFCGSPSPMNLHPCENVFSSSVILIDIIPYSIIY
jgi:hypothetical protein